jgi:hypothetical protein
MTTQQMLLTIGALLLLSILILRVNTSQIMISDAQTDSKFTLVAISLANSMLEEAKQKAFDEACVDASVKNELTELTTTANLGKDAGEVYPDFDDFDDYAYFSYPDNPLIDTTAIYNSNTGQYETFRIYARVGYVEPNNLDVFVANRTWYKKMTVRVECDAIEHPVEISTIYGYWFFLQ